MVYLNKKKLDIRVYAGLRTISLLHKMQFNIYYTNQLVRQRMMYDGKPVRTIQISIILSHFFSTSSHT